jgi:hypothetical protein
MLLERIFSGVEECSSSEKRRRERTVRSEQYIYPSFGVIEQARPRGRRPSPSCPSVHFHAYAGHTAVSSSVICFHTRRASYCLSTPSSLLLRHVSTLYPCPRRAELLPRSTYLQCLCGWHDCWSYGIKPDSRLDLVS